MSFTPRSQQIEVAQGEPLSTLAVVDLHLMNIKHIRNLSLVPACRSLDLSFNRISVVHGCVLAS